MDRGSREAGGEGSIEEWLGQVGLAQYADLFHTLGITGDKTEIANLDEAGVADMVNTCVSEGGVRSETTVRFQMKHASVFRFECSIGNKRGGEGKNKSKSKSKSKSKLSRV